MIPRSVLIVLLVANVLVLLGMLWPEQAPSFARTVNLATLVADVLVFALILRGRSKRD